MFQSEYFVVFFIIIIISQIGEKTYTVKLEYNEHV
jgi:hypothetical protein